MPWFVLHTKPKQELKTAAKLEAAGYTIFCPTTVELRQWSDRKKKVTVPLLPSMILICIPENLRSEVFRIPGVTRYLFWLGKPATVSETEMAKFQHLLQQPHDGIIVNTLKVGDPVNINNLGTHPKTGIIKQFSENQCWVELKELGCVIKLKINELQA